MDRMAVSTTVFAHVHMFEEKGHNTVGWSLMNYGRMGVYLRSTCIMGFWR